MRLLESLYQQLRQQRRMQFFRTKSVLCSFFFILFSLAFSACAESDDEEQLGEYADWQARNEAYFLTLEDSLNSNPAVWRKLRTYSMTDKATTANTDYVYVKVLQTSELTELTESPIYTDTVRVAYRGRLIPSASYPQGYVFDQTYVGNFDLRTTDVSNLAVKGYVDGFATALQHMHIGDQWRIYIPYQLGYGTTAKSSIPAYSTLIFDLVLIDFVSGSDKMEPWSARGGALRLVNKE